MSSESEVAASLQQAVTRLAAFLERPLTEQIAQLERDIDGCSGDGAAEVVRAAGVDGPLLDAAIDVRGRLGRINDLIHAAAIVLSIPRILRPGERLVRRPSLAAGNDPSRPFDLETDLRVAEFKLAVWKGADAMRKRQTVKDLVHLAAEDSGRQPELYVVGAQPIHFLRTSRSTVGWALDRSPSAAQLFVERFGPLTTAIADFTSGAASHVNVIDLVTVVPDVMNRLVPPGD